MLCAVYSVLCLLVYVQPFSSPDVNSCFSRWAEPQRRARVPVLHEVVPVQIKSFCFIDLTSTVSVCNGRYAYTIHYLKQTHTIVGYLKQLP